MLSLEHFNTLKSNGAIRIYVSNDVWLNIISNPDFTELFEPVKSGCLANISNG